MKRAIFTILVSMAATGCNTNPSSVQTSLQCSTIYNAQSYGCEPGRYSECEHFLDSDDIRSRTGSRNDLKPYVSYFDYANVPFDEIGSTNYDIIGTREQMDLFAGVLESMRDPRLVRSREAFKNNTREAELYTLIFLNSHPDIFLGGVADRYNLNPGPNRVYTIDIESIVRLFPSCLPPGGAGGVITAATERDGPPIWASTQCAVLAHELSEALLSSAGRGAHDKGIEIENLVMRDIVGDRADLPYRIVERPDMWGNFSTYLPRVHDDGARLHCDQPVHYRYPSTNGNRPADEIVQYHYGNAADGTPSKAHSTVTFR